MSETKTNFPPPSSLADQIIEKAIELLNADVWERETEHTIVIRGVLFAHKEVTIPIHKDGSPILKEGKPSEAYAEAFKEAYQRAMARERDRRMTPLFRRISSASLDARIRWARRTVRAFAAGVPIVIGVAFLSWATASISSCSEQAAKAAEVEAARDNEVNRYGFKRGNINVGYRYTYPDSCDGHGKYSSLYECKYHFERWERSGEVWVDWKDDPQ